MAFRAIFVGMKLPFKHIALLVILSLVGIFAYQAYWLVTMYHTMQSQADATIRAAIKNADHVELFMRTDSVSKQEKKKRKTGAKADDEINISFSTTFEKDEEGETRQSVLMKETTKKGAVKNVSEEKERQTIYPGNSTRPMIGENISSLYALVAELQQGLHAALDDSLPVNLVKFDSIFRHDLLAANLDVPHYTQALDRRVDSVIASTLPLGMDTAGMKRFDYLYSRKDSCTYRVYIQSPGIVVLRQMSGILATSFIILLILGFSFWYLIRTLLKQKTLEEMKTDFTNNVTHELKTPIAVAYAANDALLNFNQAEEKEKRDKYLRIGQEQLQRLSRLVEQILTMSMESRKNFRLHTEEIQLKPLLDSLVEQHKLKAPKPVSISCHIDPENLSVLADPVHFGNMVSNLIDNAIKYTPGETVIRIKCNRHSNQVQIAVSDQGIGISAERQKHVFDKFYRVPTGNLHNVKGYGLGLYYVKTMIEKHGGTVSVKSEPGHGSTFTLTL